MPLAHEEAVALWPARLAAAKAHRIVVKDREDLRTGEGRGVVADLGDGDQAHRLGPHEQGPLLEPGDLLRGERVGQGRGGVGHEGSRNVGGLSCRYLICYKSKEEAGTKLTGGMPGESSLRRHPGAEHRENSMMNRRSLLAAVLAVSAAVVFLPPQGRADSSTLVYADAGEPSTIDPAKANINCELTVTRNVYDRLINYDLADPGKLLPGLATE